MNFVLACIKIPIEIREDGSTNPMVDRSEIEFSKCDELPPKKNDPNAFVIEKLSSFLTAQKSNNEAHNKISTEESNQKVISTPSNFSFSEKITDTEKEQIVKLFVTKDEINNVNKKRGQTVTFKNNIKIKKNRTFTEKMRPSLIAKDEVVDSAQSLKGQA